MNNFSKNIRFLREQRALKLSDFERYGIKTGTMSNYELGKTEPKLETIIFFSKFFRKTVDCLLFSDCEVFYKHERNELTEEEGMAYLESQKKLRSDYEILTPITQPQIQPQLDVNLTPNVTPKEKDDYNPSDPKFNADFSAIDINKTSNQPQQPCQACIEKDNTIVALWELIKAKGDTIKTKDDVIAAKDAIIAAKDETIRSKDEQIDELFEKRDDDFDLADTPVSSAS